MVQRHYSSELTVESVAKALAISPRQLQRIYAQFSDTTFHDDLVGRRLEAAARLLSIPSITVRDVARQVGFHQSPHFARAFQRRYGVSPSTYRAKLDRAT
jgi:AraC family transcriptional regulator of adaptative response / methylphosphotriester-DNA alkyltransferase methyltransferase